MATSLSKPQIAWAFYDWANSAFATVVMAGFFPIFFKQYWNVDVAATDSTFRLGLANSLASLVIVISAPILGAIADQGNSRKGFLVAFALLGVVSTAGLYLVGQGQWQYAMALYILGTIGFMGGNVFYDALLTDVAKPAETDRISALGFAVGYLGGGLAFALCVWMSLMPEFFGLADASEAVRLSFLIVAFWWVVFTLPLLRIVQQRALVVREHDGRRAVRDGFRQLIDTFRHIRQYKPLMLFLLAYWIYIDGVDTIVRMAVDYGLSLGFPSESLIVALLITQFVGFPAALAFGYLGEKIGTKNGILLGLSVYAMITVWGYFLDTVWEFYALAIAIGLVQGGVQALSRSLYARMIPQDRAAEFFGFYNMLGKFAAVFGPILMGTVAVITGDARLSILSVLVFFILGGVLLYFVKEERQPV